MPPPIKPPIPAWSAQALNVQIGCIYQHYRNKVHYRVVCLALEESTMREKVVYRPDKVVFEARNFERPVDEWTETVIDEDTCLPVQRFKLLHSIAHKSRSE